MQENAVNRLKSYLEDIFRDRNKIIRILLIIMILLLSLAVRLHEDHKSDITVEDNTGIVTDAEGGNELCVDISGAVVNPGVYNVSPNTRLFEVIEMAGGLISDADTDSINRAEYVEDGEKIIIPMKRLPSDDDMQALSESSDSGLVNINYASREELMTLNGIGASKADSIIEYRSSTRFKSKEDIKSVNGIGDSIYNKIKDSITV